MKKVDLPIQSGSNDPARDSEYLLPETEEKRGDDQQIDFARKSRNLETSRTPKTVEWHSKKTLPQTFRGAQHATHAKLKPTVGRFGKIVFAIKRAAIILSMRGTRTSRRIHRMDDDVHCNKMHDGLRFMNHNFQTNYTKIK